ncbi:MAG: A24 family peptidase [Saccharofermentans sp.]|nr:A24 family peptidase [Saccharofermentans sp.]
MIYYFIAIPAAIALGALMGYLDKILFAKFPEAWLQDYGVSETDVNYRISKRMRMFPEAVVAMGISAAMYVAAVIFLKPVYFDTPKPLHIAVIVLMVPVLVLIMMADKLNRIIPDQFSVALGLIGIVSIAADLVEGSIWFTPEAPWYYPLVSKILAALIGGGFLFLVGFIALTFTGREGMGQGDMRLLLATGLITGMYGLIVLVYVSIFTAVLFAIPMLIKKRIRIQKEEEMIRNSKNPQKLRRALEIKKARMHFADDPDYLAFGPFIALGCGVFAVMEPVFLEQLMSYLSGLGVFF